jgi:hypothetical protein
MIIIASLLFAVLVLWCIRLNQLAITGVERAEKKLPKVSIAAISVGIFLLVEVCEQWVSVP